MSCPLRCHLLLMYFLLFVFKTGLVSPGDNKFAQNVVLLLKRDFCSHGSLWVSLLHSYRCQELCSSGWRAACPSDSKYAYLNLICGLGISEILIISDLDCWTMLQCELIPCTFLLGENFCAFVIIQV